MYPHVSTNDVFAWQVHGFVNIEDYNVLISPNIYSMFNKLVYGKKITLLFLIKTKIPNAGCMFQSINGLMQLKHFTYDV